jgi:hypothetical protein
MFLRLSPRHHQRVYGVASSILAGAHQMDAIQALVLAQRIVRVAIKISRSKVIRVGKKKTGH